MAPEKQVPVDVENKLTTSEVLKLIEFHGLKLPTIPTQLEEDFYILIRNNYEAELHSVVKTIVMHFLNLENMTHDEGLNSLAISGLMNLLDKNNFDSLFKVTLDRQKELLQKAVTAARMESRNFIDNLTRLYNKRAFIYFFEKKLEWLRDSAQHWEQEPQLTQVLLLIMVDLDHFKDINDQYGHQGGDEVLSTLGLSIAKQLKNNDLVFRWGGDEFVLLLQINQQDLLDKYGDVKTGLTAVTNQIHERLSSHEFTANGDQVKINLTFGATRILPEDIAQENGTEHINSALKRADEALYAAKNAGKNQAQLKLRSN